MHFFQRFGEPLVTHAFIIRLTFDQTLMQDSQIRKPNVCEFCKKQPFNFTNFKYRSKEELQLSRRSVHMYWLRSLSIKDDDDRDDGTIKLFLFYFKDWFICMIIIHSFSRFFFLANKKDCFCNRTEHKVLLVFTSSPTVFRSFSCLEMLISSRFTWNTREVIVLLKTLFSFNRRRRLRRWCFEKLYIK